jgi:hypothetical protein
MLGDLAGAHLALAQELQDAAPGWVGQRSVDFGHGGFPAIVSYFAK